MLYTLSVSARELFESVPSLPNRQTLSIENVAKGQSDRPVEDVIIADSGELPLPAEEETVAEGEKVQPKEDL